MAHFVKMSNMDCGQVIVVSNDDCDNLPFPDSEPVGQAFIASLGIEGNWLQTSYNGSFRNCYAGVGFTFDASIGEYGVFVAPLADETPIEP